MEAQANTRCSIMDGLEREIVVTIQRALSQVYPIVEMFLRAGEFTRNREVLNVRLAIREAPGIELRTHNRPTCNEVSAKLRDVNMGGERNIILRSVLFWGITQRRVVILYRRFGTTYRSHFHWLRSLLGLPTLL
jgi:hypothetical protein